MVILLLAGLLVASTTAPVPSTAALVVERPDLEAVFSRHGVAGTFVLFDVIGGRVVFVDRARAQRPYVPASTFKIPNSLIALETGAVKDEGEIVPYGGGPQPFPQWERDMNLRDAIRASNVPVYQEIARRIGRKKMQSNLNRLRYGNLRIGEEVDRFWLDGPLEISAFDQAQFLARLAQGNLPMSGRSQRIVRDMLRVEERGGAVLFAKTGWYSGEGPMIGWWVGWVEREDRVYVFALNIDMASAEDTPKRLLVGHSLLGALGVLPAP